MKIVQSIDIDAAVEALEDGELVIVPTSRWYMICCDATNDRACQRIFKAKQRPPDKSLLLVVPSITVAHQRLQFTRDADALAEAFWPGDLAMIIPWRDPDDGQRLSAVGACAALVNQDGGVLGELARRAHVLVAATSVNISGDASPADPGPAISLSQVSAFLSTADVEVRVVVDGGICPTANHLTIVDCTGERARIVRPGVIHERAVFAALAKAPA